MINFAQVGNDLYTGKRSIDFVGRQKLWYLISAVLIALAAAGLIGRGLNFGIEFTGGTEFRVSQVADTSGYEGKANDAIDSAGITGNVTTTVVGGNGIRVQTEAAEARTDAARTALGKAFGVPADRVSASLIGPSWGEAVSQQAIRGLVVFLALVTLFMAFYFRTWKMAVSALVALLHDLLITVGIYALFGFEVTPSSMIGFLTILGYSLYDTVVVFDKVRENTTEALAGTRVTYSEAANLAVNQTLVRSINTTVVALLPIAAILFVGFTMLGPGTLLDLSLALFIGIAVGAYSSIFIATPLLVDLRRGERAIKDHDQAVLRQRARQGEDVAARNASGVIIAPTSSAGAAGSSAPAASSGATALDAVDAPREPDPTRDAVVGAPGPSGSTGAGRATAAAGADRSSDQYAQVQGRQVHKWAQSGPRNQPRRPPKSKR